MAKQSGPKLLFLDIETAPIVAYTWGLWDQTIGLNQIKEDWSIISWSAKWQGDAKILYEDQRSARNIRDDKRLVQGIWKLLDEADIIVTQNGKAFDEKKLNARFILNGMKPPSSYKHIDTKQLAKRHFAFTSNRLEYMSSKLCKAKKLKHAKFPGFELWEQCLAKNLEAWKEMEAYNKQDVLALEELYEKLAPWSTKVNFNVYHDREDFICQCGHPAFQRYGFSMTNAGKFQRFKCKKCGAEYRSKINEFTKEKRKSLLVGK